MNCGDHGSGRKENNVKRQKRWSKVEEPTFLKIKHTDAPSIALHQTTLKQYTCAGNSFITNRVTAQTKTLFKVREKLPGE